MHVDRLVRMAKLLEKDAADPNGVKFDLSFWAIPSIANQAFEPARHWATKEAAPMVNCGTTACALGLAVISGEFKQEGLEAFYLEHWCDGYDLIPVVGETKGFEAGAHLFNITVQDSRYLFDPDCYDGTVRGKEAELKVAKRIRDFIDGDIDKKSHPHLRYSM